MVFEGASEEVVLTGERKLEGHYSFFLGSEPSRWRSEVRGYGSIRYRGLYPAIDLRLREEEGKIEYDLLLAPGAEVSRVVVRCEGIEDLDIDSQGALVMQTALGPIRQSVPRTWQELPSGRRKEVACHYQRLNRRRYRFEVEGHDSTLPLVIDPGLEWSTYLGGSDIDGADAVVVDGSGETVVGGVAGSMNFPTTAGAYDTSFSNWRNVSIVLRHLPCEFSVRLLPPDLLT